MGRLMGGVVVCVAGLLGLVSTILGGSFDIIAALILFVIILTGLVVAYFGWTYIVGRQRALPVIERMAQESDLIDTPAAAEQTSLSLERIREHVQYAKMKGYVDRNTEVK